MKRPDNIKINVSPKPKEYKVIIDGVQVGRYNTIQEISEKAIEGLGKHAKKIYIEEVTRK